GHRVYHDSLTHGLLRGSGVSVSICFAARTPAPTSPPTTRPATPVATAPTLPDGAEIGAKPLPGVWNGMPIVACIGVLNARSCSVQPKHGWPRPIGHASGTSQKSCVEQFANVCGPLQPSSYRH